jgi:hypothetical protein
MYKVRCGVKLNHLEEGQVFGSNKNFDTIGEAKNEVNNMLNNAVKGLFKNITHSKLSEINEDYTAWYENQPEYFLKARMDGQILDENNEGEFYIEIVEPNLKIN